MPFRNLKVLLQSIRADWAIPMGTHSRPMGPGTTAAILLGFACACGGGGSSATGPNTPPTPESVVISLSPLAVSVMVGASQTFTATVANTTHTAVTWQVDGVNGGTSSVGTISGGIYTAPMAVPSPVTVTVTAVSQADPTLSASALVSIVAAPGGSTFFVSPGGLDTNPGTLAAPWKTIQHAANVAMPGSLVSVRGGVYNETVRISVSGTASGGYITFQSFVGEQAILDGTTPTHLSTGGGGGGLFSVQGQSYIIIQGFELRNFTTNLTSESPAGILVSGSGSHIQILNNHIHDITTSAPDSPTKLTSNAFGIVVKGTALTNPLTSIVIDGNELDHLRTGASESLTVNGNVDGFSITHNRLHDNNNIGIDCIGHEGINGSPQGNTDPNDSARNGVVSDNTVYNISSYGNPAYGNAYSAVGIYVDGGSHIVIERNIIHDTDINLEVASEWPGNTSNYITVRNNLIYNGLACGISIGGYDSKRGGTDHCDFVNNTLYGNDTKNQGGGEFQIQYYATNIRFENNILHANPSGLFLNSVTGSTSGVAIDYNLFYATSGGIAVGTHSQFADPKLVNAGAADFHLPASSPAVGAGVDLGALVVGTMDFAGNPRVIGTIDMGAYEQ